MISNLFFKYLMIPFLFLFGFGFVYRLMHIPSRLETAIFCIAFFLIPTLKYPKVGVYYLFCLPLFIPLFRRMYYLVSERPTLDYLMLISDGVMGGLIMAMILLWILNKERSKDLFSSLIVIYTLLLFIKVFLGAQLGMQEGLYGFKFNGLYVFFFFAGSYVLRTYKETRAILGYSSWLLFITALYGINQILFGFTDFERKWLDSITFTTLRIDGVVRPFSTYVSPAAMSDGMTILFVLGIFWVFAKGRHLVPFGILLTASSIAPIMIATVRTNWLAVAAGLLFYGFFLRLKKTWVQWSLIAVMALGMVGISAKGSGGGGGSMAQNAVISAKVNRKNPNLTETMITNRTAALANPLQEYSVQKRMETWMGIIYTSFYFPLGKGQGTTGYAHSYYFLVLGEIGYPGFLCFLAILFVGFYRGMKVIANSKDEDVAELLRLLVTIIFMLTVLNLTGTHLHTPPGDIFFWFTMGCISRFYRQWRQEEALEKAARAALAVPPADAPEPSGSVPAELPGTPGRAVQLPRSLRGRHP
ncbi:MAG TPA: hypothetical protein VJ385_13580 [Fibrobacteria bacterium]|nr:hypothetical protein [Fibrobacteria bacterium]